MTLRVELVRSVELKFFQASGHDYEVFDGEHLVAHGWAAGSAQRAKVEALDHARRVIRMREKLRAPGITGER